jgi:hypothetical protein
MARAGDELEWLGLLELGQGAPGPENLTERKRVVVAESRGDRDKRQRVATPLTVCVMGVFMTGTSRSTFGMCRPRLSLQCDLPDATECSSSRPL